MTNVTSLILPKDLRLYVFPGNYRGHEHREAYQEAYQCWQEVWSAVYLEEMHLHHEFYADDFLRQEQIVALFHGTKCAGLAFMRPSDLSLSPIRQDSFFRYWPKSVIERIHQESENVTLASYFTVHQDYRQNKLGICWKELLLALFQDNFLQGPSDLMVTSARKRKSNQKLCQKLGATILEANVAFTIDGKVMEEEQTDIVCWKKQRTSLEDPALQNLRDEVWNKRIDLIHTLRKLKGVKDVA